MPTTIAAPPTLSLVTERGEFAIAELDEHRDILGWYDATERVPSWVWTDSHGHPHRYTTVHGERVLTLAKNVTYWCHDCRDEHDREVCSLCGDDIDFRGSTRSVGQKPMIGEWKVIVRVVSAVDPGESGEIVFPTGERMTVARTDYSTRTVARMGRDYLWEWRSIWENVGAPVIAPRQGS